nr:competence protein [Roseobacter sp.]
MTWLKASCERVLLGQRGALYPWAPVGLAFGIGGYFALPMEPPLWAYGLAALVIAAGGFLLLRHRSVFHPLIWALVLLSLGFG